MVYYAALGKATRSPVLRAICQQILLDEVPHIRFQCERLATLHQDRSRAMYALTLSCHRLFFTVMTLLIWLGHARALRAGGLNFRRFWRSSWARMDVAWRLMNPRAYRWPATERRGPLAAGLPTCSFVVPIRPAIRGELGPAGRLAPARLFLGDIDQRDDVPYAK